MWWSFVSVQRKESTVNNMNKKMEKIKGTLLFVAVIPFVLISSLVLHWSGADRDTWPSEEEMKAGGVHERK